VIEESDNPKDNPLALEKSPLISVAEIASVTLCPEFQSSGRTRSVAAAVMVAPALFATVTVPAQSTRVLLLAWETVAGTL